MTAADAKAHLRRVCAAASEPELQDADIDALEVLSRRADSAGVAPDDAAWVPTYDLNAGAAEGWRIKAGKAVGLNATRAGDEQRFDPMHLQCKEMAEHYQRRVRPVSIVTRPPGVTG